MGTFRDNEYLIKDVANYIIKNKATIRDTSKRFDISKTSIHNFIRSYLPEIEYSLYLQAYEVLKFNKEERCVRGGIASSYKNEESLKKDVKNMMYYKMKELEESVVKEQKGIEKIMEIIGG